MKPKNKKNIKLFLFVVLPFLFILLTFFSYLIPNNTIKEVNSINYLSDQLITFIKFGEKNSVKIVEAKKYVPEKGYFYSIKDNPDLKQQENGTSSMYFNINEKTRTLYIYSNGYNKQFCEDIISWTNPKSIRNSSLGKLFQVNDYEQMSEFKEISKFKLKMNGKEVLDDNLSCDESNDIVYITQY